MVIWGLNPHNQLSQRERSLVFSSLAATDVPAPGVRSCPCLVLGARQGEATFRYEENKNRNQPTNFKENNLRQSSWSLHFSLILKSILYTVVT